ncbi:uncharacterized protein LOC100904346 [Galendromus occidentalis]|uniref:Uncharacterized protein LOC100904346 n=1 Tax=Galendromus occidentalis TaxID=34638 RepID=A0AAJ6VUV0_9ACAR|nr:uncharacterized protein LOC100904346 [Galendromus occidentalis]
MESSGAVLACRQLGDHPVRHILPAKMAPLMKYSEAKETCEVKEFDQESFAAGKDDLSQEWDEFVQDYPECERFLDTDTILKIQNGGSYVEREDIVFPASTYRVDLSGFSPEDVEVRTHGTKLNVSASHEQRNDDGSVYTKMDLVKEFRLPDTVDKDKLHSELQDGMHLLVHTGADI